MARGLSVRVEVQGLGDLTRRLQDLSDRVSAEETLRGAVREGAGIVRDRARSLAPVGTESLGRRDRRLRDGIVVRAINWKKDGGFWETVSPLREVAHANLQEFGTVHHEAQPFMRPAFDQTRHKAVARVRGILAREVRKALR